MKVLLGVTGSVAAIKMYKLTKALLDEGHEVRVVVTEKGEFFAKKGCSTEEWASVYQYVRVDEDEWKWGEVGDKVMHIDLKDWADIMVIAPLTANTLAKMANGLCDNLLTCVVRAWPLTKPMVLAPAMNTDMWEKRMTDRHIDTVRVFCAGGKVTVIDPVKKELACGTFGVGAMAHTDVIVEYVRKAGA